MPRARVNHKLVRIPIQPEVAYDLAYYFDPRKDEELVKKHADKVGEFGVHMMSALRQQKMMTPKQRIVFLKMEYPRDMRLKAIESCIAKGSKKWLARFRSEPIKAYQEEADAVARAIRDIDCEAKILAAVD